jgi:hypothetical protein
MHAVTLLFVIRNHYVLTLNTYNLEGTFADLLQFPCSLYGVTQNT